MQIYAVHVDNVGLAPFAAATIYFPDLVAFNWFHRKLPMFYFHPIRRDGGVQASKWQADFEPLTPSNSFTRFDRFLDRLGRPAWLLPPIPRFVKPLQ
jgi:hypothetical protein